jgi:hypothetical protein
MSFGSGDFEIPQSLMRTHSAVPDGDTIDAEVCASVIQAFASGREIPPSILAKVNRIPVDCKIKCVQLPFRIDNVITRVPEDVNMDDDHLLVFLALARTIGAVLPDGAHPPFAFCSGHRLLQTLLRCVPPDLTMVDPLVNPVAATVVQLLGFAARGGHYLVLELLGSLLTIYYTNMFARSRVDPCMPIDEMLGFATDQIAAHPAIENGLFNSIVRCSAMFTPIIDSWSERLGDVAPRASMAPTTMGIDGHRDRSAAVVANFFSQINKIPVDALHETVKWFIEAHGNCSCGLTYVTVKISTFTFYKCMLDTLGLVGCGFSSVF